MSGALPLLRARDTAYRTSTRQILHNANPSAESMQLSLHCTVQDTVFLKHLFLTVRDIASQTLPWQQVCTGTGSTKKWIWGGQKAASKMLETELCRSLERAFTACRMQCRHAASQRPQRSRFQRRSWLLDQAGQPCQSTSSP